MLQATMEVNENNELEMTLNERGNRYGLFKNQSTLSQDLKNSVFTHASEFGKFQWSKAQTEAMEMILHKIARIANGDPNYDDSWRDIAGYAELVVKELNGRGV